MEAGHLPMCVITCPTGAMSFGERDGILAKASGVGVPVYGTTTDGTPVYESDLGSEGLILFGNESKGISPGLLRHVTSRITIPGPAQPGGAPWKAPGQRTGRDARVVHTLAASPGSVQFAARAVTLSHMHEKSAEHWCGLRTLRISASSGDTSLRAAVLLGVGDVHS